MSGADRPFTITARDAEGRARAGILRTAHGEVENPVLMPVATQGSIKALSQEDLDALGVQAILANSYHLYLRPGAGTVAAAGGLHSFMSYRGSILTDSVCFQVLSLSGLREVKDEGVTFRSHLDGSEHTLTPESVVALQAELGSDIWTALDEPAEYPCTPERARAALRRTQRWLEASEKTFKELSARRERPALFFPILQGGLFADLRREAAEHMAGIDHQGVSLGGFSVGEPKELTWETLSRSTEVLPQEKPRYLMGVGAPGDLWEAVNLGVDMMDCVWPTRLARNGYLLTRQGRLNITNARFSKDFSPIEEGCPCPACRRHSRAYLCHLYKARELSAYRLLSLHNLQFTLGLMREIREALRAGRFQEARREFLSGEMD